MPSQTYGNHKRYVLGYHGITFGLIVIVLFWSLKEALSAPSIGAAVEVIAALAMIGLFFYARAFALQAQNRLIRLEEQLRLARLLPPDLQDRIGDIRVAQLVALRFAPDAEVAGIVRRILAGELTDQAAIKQAIKEWRPDFVRV